MVSSTTAKSNDGTIQITFTIPYAEIAVKRSEVIKKLGRDITVDGFRKGMAPADQVEAKLGEQVITERVLSQILPKALSEAVAKEKLSLGLYPKFELISAEKDHDWQVRAVSCEMPTVTLGDYQKEIDASTASAKIWTPDKGKPDEKKTLSEGEKENLVLTAILKTTIIHIPQLLINEEVENRLAGLLARLEKLSLKLEGYLSSVGKTPESLRAEYVKQVTESLTLELALNEIAQSLKTRVDADEIAQAIKVSLPEVKEEEISDSHRAMIKGIVVRQKTLHQLAQKIL